MSYPIMSICICILDRGSIFREKKSKQKQICSKSVAESDLIGYWPDFKSGVNLACALLDLSYCHR